MCKNRFTACHGRQPSGRANAFHLHRVLLSSNKGKWGATPCLFGSVRVIFLSGYAAPFAVASYGMARKPEIQAVWKQQNPHIIMYGF